MPHKEDSINPAWQYDTKINTFLKRIIIGIIEPNYCKNKYGFDFPWWKKNNILDSVSLAMYYFFYALLILFVISSLIPSVNAAQTLNSSVTVNGTTDTTITFKVYYKTDVRAIGATFDGVSIEGFDLLHNTTYVAKELEPNSTHTFCIYKDLINCETATTTDTKTSGENIIDFFWKWLMLFVIVALMFIGTKIPLFDIIAFVFALISWLQAVISQDFYFFLIWSCCLMATMFIGYTGVKGEL